MSKETKVKCDVESCMYNKEKCCDLRELDISCTCDGCDCNDVDETICKSFAKKENSSE